VYVEADCTKEIVLPESYGADTFTYANCDSGFLCSIARNLEGQVVGGTSGAEEWYWEGSSFQYQYSGLAFSGRKTFSVTDRVQYEKHYRAAILQLGSSADGPRMLREFIAAPWCMKGAFWLYSCGSWLLLDQSTETVGGVTFTKTLYFCSACRTDLLGSAEGHICYEIVALADQLLVCWSAMESLCARQGGRFEADGGAVVLHVTGRDGCGILSEEPFSFATSCVNVNTFVAEAASEAASVFDYVFAQF